MRSSLLIIASLCATLAHASDRHEIDLGGTVSIAPDGAVTAVDLQPGLQPVIADAVVRAVSAWRFEPLDEPVDARMALRLEAEPVDGGLLLRVARVSFGEWTAPDVRGRMPSFPRSALEAGVEGVVDLRLLVGAGGEVEHAHVYRAGTAGGRRVSPARRANIRQLFERAVLHAVQGWRFDAAPGATVGYRIEFVIDGGIGPVRAAWRAYEYGDEVPPPWERTADDGLFAALGNGEAVVASARVRLAENVVGSIL